MGNNNFYTSFTQRKKLEKPWETAHRNYPHFGAKCKKVPILIVYPSIVSIFTVALSVKAGSWRS
jgi:hypothetical protein